MTVPAVRARTTRDFIDYLDVVDPGRSEAVLVQVPADARSALAAAGPSDWISIEHSRHWLEAYVRGVGAAVARETFARCVEARIATSPVMREVTTQLVALGQRGPEAVVRFVPHALSLGYRDFFRARVVDVHDAGALVLFEDVAPEVVRYSTYFVCFEGILMGALRLAGRARALAVITMRGQIAQCELEF